jgi:hypothetical protein
MTTERAGKWNYRVLRRGEEYSIHEVYYDSELRIQGASGEPARLVACSLDELPSVDTQNRPLMDI